MYLGVHRDSTLVYLDVHLNLRRVHVECVQVRECAGVRVVMSLAVVSYIKHILVIHKCSM